MYSVISFLFMMILPVPGTKRTRAVEFLRLPVAIYCVCAIDIPSLN